MTEIVLAVIGDVHAHFRRLDVVLERLARERLDGVLLVGDLGSHDLAHAARRTPQRDARYLASLDRLFEKVGMLGVPCAWVPGNHDLPTLPRAGNVDGSVIEIAGVRVAGIGGAGPQSFGFSYEWTEDEIRARVVPPCDVLISHTPPFATKLDRLLDGEPVGSRAIREIASKHDGVLVCGHIHEASGFEQLGACLCFNVGALGEPFGAAQVGFVRIDDALPGRFEAVHEQLERNVVTRCEREPVQS